MEIYFDRRTLRLLRYIRWHPGNTLEELLQRFPEDDAVDWVVINLCRADYLVCRRPDGTYTQFEDGVPLEQHREDNFWVSPKGNQLLEERFARIWQWAIPTLISVAALIISILDACFPGVIRVQVQWQQPPAQATEQTAPAPSTRTASPGQTNQP